MENLSKNIYLNLLSVISILFFAGCVGSRLPRDLNPHQVVQPQSVGTIQNAQREIFKGVYRTLQNETKPIATPVNSDYQVLIFAQEFCLVCGEEANDLVAALKPHLPEAPKKVSLLTVLVESDIESIQPWSDDHGVLWEVGVLDDMSLLKQYCERPQTPCTVVLNSKNEILYRQMGKISQTDLEKITGSWF